MVQVLMTETHQASRYGYSPPELFEEGEVYDVPSSLAEVFLKEGWAEELEVKEADGSPEKKDQGGANENKGQGGKKEDEGPPEGKLKALVDIDYLPEGGAMSWVFKKGSAIAVPDQIPHEVAAHFIKEKWVHPVGGKNAGIVGWFKSVLKG